MNQRPGTALPSSPVSSFQRWRLQIFAITWLAYAAFYFTRKAFSVAKLGIAEDPGFQLDKMAMADLDAIYLAAYAVGQFTWGVLADRFGPRIVVFGGLLISALAAVVMGTFATLPIFATCMVVQGLAQSTGWSGLCKNIGSFFATHERGRVLGLWSTCYAFGGLVASPFAGWWAYSVFGTWHAAFYSSAAVVGGVALLFLLLQRNRPEDVGHPPVEPQVASEAVRYAGFRPEGGNGGNGGKRRQPAGTRQGGAQPHGALPRPGLLPAQAGALRDPPVGTGDRLRTHAGARQGRRGDRSHRLRGSRPARPDPDRLRLGQAVRRTAHAGLRDQPAGADRLPGAVRPGDDHRQAFR
ncbi:sugar MFS transporter [Pseudomonas aeruginosa]|nr:sugar MFS transporter [Pseudomonas aeruginosa]